MSNPNLVIDFGGTCIKLAIMQDGVVASHSVFDNDASTDPLDRAVELAHNLFSETGLTTRELGGVGLCFPGIMDTQAKTLLSINKKHSNVVGIDLAAWARKYFALPLSVDNDARMALLGETGYGVAKGCRNAVTMMLGTGIGTAALIEGKLLRGAHFQAGILGGHLTVDANGHRCTCGNLGCAEAEAGSWNIPTFAREHPEFDHSALRHAPVLDFKAISDAYRAGDRVASGVLARLVRIWSICVVNLIHAYDPEIVVLGGGLMKSHDLFLREMRDYIAENAWIPSGMPELRVASDSDLSVLMGLDYLINHPEHEGCRP